MITRGGVSSLPHSLIYLVTVPQMSDTPTHAASPRISKSTPALIPRLPCVNAVSLHRVEVHAAMQRIPPRRLLCPRGELVSGHTHSHSSQVSTAGVTRGHQGCCRCVRLPLTGVRAAGTSYIAVWLYPNRRRRARAIRRTSHDGSHSSASTFWFSTFASRMASRQARSQALAQRRKIKTYNAKVPAPGGRGVVLGSGWCKARTYVAID